MPPRGKKAGTGGEKKDTQKGSLKEESVPQAPEPIHTEVPISEITSFIDSHVGDSTSIKSLTSLVLNSSMSASVIRSCLDSILTHVKSSSALLPWGKACIESIFSSSLDPKTRIKDAFFFPNPDSEKKLIKYLKLAKKTLIVAVFTLTNDDLATEVRRAKARGVDIRIISDDDLLKMQGSDIRNMYNEGIQVRVDLDPRAQMHHKFCVIDDYLLVTGSFNWTKQAVNKNQENLVVLDDPELCEIYTKEFDRMWLAFEPSVQKYFGGPLDPTKVQPPPDPNEKKPYKKKKKDENVEEIVKSQEDVKVITVGDVEELVIKSAGDLNALPLLSSYLNSVLLDEETVNKMLKIVFDLVQNNPTHAAWGKSCIQVLFNESLDPKTRIKDAFFFPNPDSEKKLIKYLKRANKSILVAVFTLTNDDLAKEIRNARARGVHIQIISDDDLMKMQGSDIMNMYNEGIEVRVDLDPRAQMHHKFCVIDDYLLITGSFNWTKQAVNKNQENLVVLDEPYLAQLYTKEFHRMWEAFEPSIEKYFGGKRVEVIKKDEIMKDNPCDIKVLEPQACPESEPTI
jgi:phosphatidylserine/phosphatidylglycerophosphate/cardiolipin synthase-like enzyme